MIDLDKSTIDENKTYIINIRDLEGCRNHSEPSYIELDYHQENKSIEEKLNMLLKDNIYQNVSNEKIKLEATLLYYSINNDIFKIERSLKDAKNIRTILLQKHDRAKEGLMLHDRILIDQTDDARNYFGILCAIYDSVAKYTLPSAKLIEDLANLQSEIEIKTKEKETSLMETIADSLQSLPINFQKYMKDPKDPNPRDVAKLLEEMSSFIEQNRSKYLNLEKKARDIYNISLSQRDIIQKDIVTILQNISEVNDKISKIEIDYDKAKDSMDQLLNYMQEKLGIEFIKEDVSMLQ